MSNQWNHTVFNLLWDCYISFCIMSLRFIQVIACINTSLLFIAEQYSIIQMSHSLSTSWSWVLLFLEFFHRAAINIRVQVFVWTYIFISLCCVLRNGIAGPFVHSMFYHLRSYQIIFQICPTILHSHQQCRKVSISPQHHQYLFPAFKKNLDWWSLTFYCVS